jgi:methionine-rich copper-binding protein CopC
MKNIVLASLALAAFGVALPAAAQNHDHGAHGADHAAHVRTTPADGAMGAAPATFTATFPHAARLTSLTVTRQGGEAIAVELPANSAASTNVSAALPALGVGNYLFAWEASSADGHTMSGTVRYMVH